MQVKPRGSFSRDKYQCSECCDLRDAGMKRCGYCSENKPIIEFYEVKSSQGKYRHSRCIPCANELDRQRTLDPVENRKIRSARLKRTFGITADQFDELLAAQGGVCAVCGEPPASGQNLHVDHDHACCPTVKTCGTCIRALCCKFCNQALGLLRDSAEIAEAAARYLRGFQEKT